MSVQSQYGLGSAAWSSDTATVAPGVTPVQVAAADPSRASVTVINDAASGCDVYLVPSASQASRGLRLAPGAALSIATVAPVYAYGVGAGTATVYVLCETGYPCG